MLLYLWVLFLPTEVDMEFGELSLGLTWLAVEAVGTLNARFHEFLQILVVASPPSPSERAAFLAFALQCIPAVSPMGTCATILARPVSRTTPPGGAHRLGALLLIQPKPRPRAAAFVSCWIIVP